MSEFSVNIKAHDWRYVHKQYQTVLQLKADKMKDAKSRELLKLDKWFQHELPSIINDREETYLSHSEICKLMTWKLTRGKFRPRLQQMVTTNSESDVKSASLNAFNLLPDLSAAIQALTVLKAIGPATASAVLAAGNQDVPFMADESVLALPGVTSLEYNLKSYLAYADKVKTITKNLEKQDKTYDWTGHKVEITLWTYYLGMKLIPDFMKRIEDHNDESEPISKKRKI